MFGRDCPDEAGEFAGAGDDDLLVWLAAGGHPLPALVEPLLAAPGAFDYRCVLAAVAARELLADGRPPARVPGGLDQEAADVAVSDLGDRALAAHFARGVLRGHQPDEGHELLGAAETAEVADLGDERERGQGLDPAQAAQPGDELAPRALLGRLPDRPLQRLDPPVDEVDRVQVGVERDLLGNPAPD